MYINTLRNGIAIATVLVSSLLLAVPAPGAALDSPAWWNGFAPAEQGGEGVNGPVRALTEYDGDLIAGGDFTSGGSVPLAHVGRWDGAVWSPLGAGLDGPVYALVVYNETLYAAGAFLTSGGAPMAHVAFWDGTVWRPAGAGVDSLVDGLAVYQGKLVVGGFFTHAGGLAANFIAAWDGSSWSSLGAGVNNDVYSLTVYQGTLAVGGIFTTAGGAPIYRLAGWDGTSWSNVYQGVNGPVWGLASWSQAPPAPPGLVAVGFYEMPGLIHAFNIAAWDGTEWNPLGPGLNGLTDCVTVYQGNVVAGGNFFAAGSTPAARVASWDGSSWSALGSGTDAVVRVLQEHAGSLYVGGEFAHAGGLPSSFIARWDGAGPATVPPGSARLSDPAASIIALAPNPCPCGQPLEISYRLPRSAALRLTLHDATGRLVGLVVSGVESAGANRARWNGLDLQGRSCPPGAYWVRLEGDGVTAGGRFLRVR